VLRKRLKEMNKFVRNQVKKPIQNPTMRWVFFLFRRITEYTINLGEAVKREVANMTDELWDILVSSQPYNVYKYAINTPYNSTL
jgi:transposase